MTTELTILVWCVALLVALVLASSALAMRTPGLAATMSNREEPLARPGVAGRTTRAHANLLENLVPFGLLVLATHAAGISNALTLWGAWFFFAARLVHAAAYVAGIKGLRTLAFNGGLLATGLIALAILVRA